LPRRWGWPLLFACGAYGLFCGLRDRQRERDSADWPIADGMITATERARVFLYNDRTGRYLRLYSVNGRQYQTDAIPLDEADEGYFQPGKILALPYCPADPSIVVAGAQTATAKIWINVVVLCVPFWLALRT
jgi:hypothetical protein